MSPPDPKRQPGGTSFLKLVFVIFIILLVVIVLLVGLSGDDGLLPFRYDGF